MQLVRFCIFGPAWMFSSESSVSTTYMQQKQAPLLLHPCGTT